MRRVARARFEQVDVLERLPDEELDVVVPANVRERFAERLSRGPWVVAGQA